MTDSRDRLLVAEMKPVVFFYYPPPRWIPFAPTDSLLFPPHFRQLAPLAPAAGVQPPFYRVSTEFCGAVATLRGTRNATWGHPIFFFCLPFADQRSVHQGPPSTEAEVHGEEGPSPLIFRQYWWRWGPYEAIRQYGLDNTAGVERGRAAADYTPAAARAKAAAERYTMGLENFAHRPHLGLVMLF